ncbi:hypothetical protein KGF56_003802 [Candida oxycetoniae]|uniref:Non-structural maintenance of chromosomes element 4 n=1 Tax=Candida oxycetoniae TaxID=497107 RepID=A0AAI9SUM7_9ASCO|nr:uncharacterized protein KGF56_003802 [Candida oxycetoniae]KAI3403381.2 hypothetical protein KGF56_003802 [Candida oxycetoniae]
MHSRQRSSSSSRSSSLSRSHVPKHTRTTKQEHFEAYNKLRQRMKNQLKEAAKGQGIHISLNNIDELTRLYSVIERDQVRDTKVHLEDSEVLKEASGFAALNARNLRFGENDVALNENDVIRKIKQYAVTDDSMLVNTENDHIEGEEEDEEDEEEEEDAEEEVITDEYSFNKINWLKLGVLYHQISKKPISVDFLYGPLASERRKAASRTRIVDDSKSGTLTTAKAVQAKDIQEDEEKNTAYMIRMIYEIYLSKDRGGEVNFYTFFIDPKSFAQSVENLFYTSFLVKDGRLKLFTGRNGYPYVARVSQKEIQENKLDSSNAISSHHIATFNYDVWEYMIKKFKIKESFLGHRDELEDCIPEEDYIEEEVEEMEEVEEEEEEEEE